MFATSHIKFWGDQFRKTKEVNINLMLSWQENIYDKRLHFYKTLHNYEYLYYKHGLL